MSDQAAASSSSPLASELERLLAAKSVVIVCGPGGVGKTSTAAAVALTAAHRLGGRVLVLTVDPARRLASAMGIDGELGNNERQIAPEVLAAAGFRWPSGGGADASEVVGIAKGEGRPARSARSRRSIRQQGELWAAMLDTKLSWDALVARHAPDDATAYRILENPLYRNLTARFAHSHDYIAMERLHELHASGAYDLIVVDTPPTRHAIDFLDAPQRMREFFGGRLLRWLTLPYRMGAGRGARLINAASRPFYQVADRALGSQFLEDIAEFFLNFQSMYDGFVERASLVERLLHDQRTTFLVVSTLEPAPLIEAKFFRDELRARELHFGALVLNRVLPSSLLSPAGAAVAEMLEEGDHAAVTAQVLATSLRGDRRLADVDRTTQILRAMAASFQDFGIVAKREAELRHELRRDRGLVVQAPVLEQDIQDLGGLAQLGDWLFAAQP